MHNIQPPFQTSLHSDWVYTELAQKRHAMINIYTAVVHVYTVYVVIHSHVQYKLDHPELPELNLFWMQNNPDN